MKYLIDQGIKVDCIVTDPPYLITSRGTNGTTGGMLTKSITRQGKIFNHNDCHVSKWSKLFFELLKDGGHAYIMTNHVNLIEYLNTLTDAGFQFIKCLIWDKQNKIMGRFYMSQFEYIIFLRKGEGIQINNCGTSDILSIPNKKTKVEGDNIHDVEKPVRLMRILIENSTKEGELVLDPFVGSGSTALACKESKRNFIGYEIDENYFNTAIERFNCHRVRRGLLRLNYN
jgi:DNA modification methylase